MSTFTESKGMFEICDEKQYTGRLQFLNTRELATTITMTYNPSQMEDLFNMVVLVAKQNDLPIYVGEMVMGIYLLTYLQYDEESFTKALHIINLSSIHN